MLKTLTDVFKKHRDVFVYLLLGVATTAVNFIVYYPLLNLLRLTATVSNLIAWSVAVIFAFFTNKPLAFKSTNWSAAVTVSEFLKFVGCRIASGILETAFLAITVDILLCNGNVMKLIISVFVVVANYIASKYFVFHK